MSEQGYPAPRAAWGMVALLTLAYLFSYIDRTVLGLLVQPIKADFALSDAQIGLLLGPAFAVFYATMGLPLGWLVDRKSRTRLIAAGVVIWSLATAASGLARSFTQLFLVRMTVGVGEAVLSPAAFSIIGDSFPPERRARPIAAYSMAITLGSGPYLRVTKRGLRMKLEDNPAEPALLQNEPGIGYRMVAEDL